MRERDLCTGPTFVHGTTDLVVQSDLLEVNMFLGMFKVKIQCHASEEKSLG
jgi:hypothetical protein